MKKLILTVALIAVFAGASLAARPANGVDQKAGSAGQTDSSAIPTRAANPPLVFVNEALYPDDVRWVDDWLCDGVAPCIELSPRRLP
jgi:hypothetical protein